MEKNAPEAKFRAGAIVATVWSNKGTTKEGKEFLNKTVKLQRGYKKQDGTWENTDSLRANDLPKAILLLSKAYEYLVTKMQQEED